MNINMIDISAVVHHYLASHQLFQCEVLFMEAFKNVFGS